VIKYCIVVCPFEEPGPLETAGRNSPTGVYFFCSVLLFSRLLSPCLNHLYPYMRKAAGKLTGGNKKKANVVGKDFCRDFCGPRKWNLLDREAS
jgi:hypothetical protein